MGRGNLVFDLDGVVYRGGEAIPDAGRALASVAARGFTIVFATNAATRTPAAVAETIAAMEIKPKPMAMPISTPRLRIRGLVER